MMRLMHGDTQTLKPLLDSKSVFLPPGSDSYVIKRDQEFNGSKYSVQLGGQDVFSCTSEQFAPSHCSCFASPLAMLEISLPNNQDYLVVTTLSPKKSVIKLVGGSDQHVIGSVNENLSQRWSDMLGCAKKDHSWTVCGRDESTPLFEVLEIAGDDPRELLIQRKEKEVPIGRIGLAPSQIEARQEFILELSKECTEAERPLLLAAGLLLGRRFVDSWQQ